MKLNLVLNKRVKKIPVSFFHHCTSIFKRAGQVKVRGDQLVTKPSERQEDLAGGKRVVRKGRKKESQEKSSVTATSLC